MGKPRYRYREASSSQLKAMILYHESFILDVDNKSELMQACAELEELIEAQSLSCRIYTEYRSAAVAVQPWALVPILLHNLATYNPDYEIGRNLISNTVTVTYKKKR